MSCSGHPAGGYRRSAATLFRERLAGHGSPALHNEKPFRQILDRYCFVDGFDECPKSERDLVLSAFKVLLASTASSIKLFVSSRPEIGREMDKSFVAYHHRTMSCREVHVDIANYIKFSIREKLVKEDLHVGDKHILSETIQALTKGAHGM